MELWRELYAKFNLYPLIGGSTGPQMGGWFKKEIESLEDLKGLGDENSRSWRRGYEETWSNPNSNSCR